VSKFVVKSLSANFLSAGPPVRYCKHCFSFVLGFKNQNKREKGKGKSKSDKKRKSFCYFPFPFSLFVLVLVIVFDLHHQPFVLRHEARFSKLKTPLFLLGAQRWKQKGKKGKGKALSRRKRSLLQLEQLS